MRRTVSVVPDPFFTSGRILSACRVTWTMSLVGFPRLSRARSEKVSMPTERFTVFWYRVDPETPTRTESLRVTLESESSETVQESWMDLVSHGTMVSWTGCTLTTLGGTVSPGEGARVTITEANVLFPALSQACTDRKSTCLNSSHANISYAVFCLKKKIKDIRHSPPLKMDPCAAAAGVLHIVERWIHDSRCEWLFLRELPFRVFGFF